MDDVADSVEPMQKHQAGKRSTGWRPIRRVAVNVDELYSGENRPVIIASPKGGTVYLNLAELYEALDVEPQINIKSISAKSRLVQYHPFFDFDLANKKSVVSADAWQRDVVKISLELHAIFGSRPTVYTRETNGGVHFIYPSLRIGSRHLFSIYESLKKLDSVLRVLSLDSRIAMFPLPMRSKDGKTFYVNSSGECEPHPIALGECQYAPLQRAGSISVWLRPETIMSAFDSGTALYRVVRGLVEQTCGCFGVVEILQHLAYYESAFANSVMLLLREMYPDTYECEYRIISGALAWTGRHHFSIQSLGSASDICTSMAISLFRIPDAAIGGVATQLHAVSKMTFNINGYYMLALDATKKQDSFREDRPGNSLGQMLENIVVFYASTGALQFKLYTGIGWCDINRDGIIRIIQALLPDSDAANAQQYFAAISGKYCRLSADAPNNKAIYLRDGGIYEFGTVVNFTEPLVAQPPVRSNVSSAEIAYGQSDTALVRVTHLLSDESLNGVCTCTVCNGKLLDETRTRDVRNAVRYIHHLMCCRPALTRWVMWLFARITFKLEKKWVIVCLGEHANNGKTEFTHVLHDAMGDYLRAISQSSCTDNRREIATDIRRAQHAALAVIDDALGKSTKSRMNAQSIKSLTGGGLQYTRGIFDVQDGQGEYQINILFTGNELLPVERDEGIFDRLINIPFKMKFQKRELDPAKWDAYSVESWRDKVSRIRGEIDSDAGLAFDAAASKNRGELARGLRLAFATIVSHDGIIVTGSNRPDEIHKNYNRQDRGDEPAPKRIKFDN